MRVFHVMCVFFVCVRTDSLSEGVCPEICLTNGHVIRVHENVQLVRYRCRHGFTLFGSRISMCLQKGEWYPAVPMCVKQGCLYPKTLRRGKIHEAKSISLKGALISFTCNKSYLRKGADRLLCDGQNWNGYLPCCVPLKDDTVACDFEDEFLCGWSQDNNDDFDWTRWRGETPTNDTGPTADYTSKTTKSHYLFLESSPPQRKHDKANLISMVFPPHYAPGRCLEFRYHMYGTDVGELSVFVTPANTDPSMMNMQQRLYHVTGHQGAEWIFGNVHLPNQARAFQIVIQGSTGSFYSDIAIDDVIIRRCSLSDSEHEVAKGSDNSTYISQESSPFNLKILLNKERQRQKVHGTGERKTKEKSVKFKKARKEKKTIHHSSRRKRRSPKIRQR